MSNLFIIALGIGTVFVGLICIIFLCMITSAVCRLGKKNTPGRKQAADASPAPKADAPIANRQEVIAAVSAVIAEELGTQANAIRIVSFKKV